MEDHMSKKTVNYRKICQEYYGYTKDQMKGMHVHHIDGNRNNNTPENLKLLTPEEHKLIHESEFIVWAHKGAILANEAFRKRLKEKGQTEKELEYREVRIAKCKEGLHRVPHKQHTKDVISQKKKQHLSNKSNHPLWGYTTYVVTDPNGNEYTVSEGWKDWCISRDLSSSNLRAVALGKRNHCRGWKARILCSKK
jgi:hypothetical protein